MQYSAKGRSSVGAAIITLILIIVFIMSAMPASSVVTGAVRYWNLDEGSGSTISDTVGGGLASVNGASWVDGLTGYGLSFDGSNDYVGMSDSPELRPSSLTVSLWMNVATMKECGLVIKRSGTYTEDANWQVEMMADGDLRFSYYDGSAWQILDTHIQPITETNRWYQVVMTFDSGDIAIYVDGSIRNSGGGYPPLDTSYTGQVQFGRGYGGYFNGVLDEITLHNRALTAAEISTDFGSYTPPDTSGQTPINPIPAAPGSAIPFSGELMAHWDFDHMKTSDVTDVTGNGNNAGTSGGAEYGDGQFWDAFVFTGTNFMETYNTDDLNLDAFTIEFWLNPSEYGTENARILEKGGYQVGGGYGIEFNRFGNHKIGFLVWNGSASYAIESDGDIPINEWTYVIASFDGASLRLYINGQMQGQPVPAAMSKNTAPMYVGRAGRAYTDLFVGRMDEMKLWEGGAGDADASILTADAEPTFMNKLNIGLGDLSGTLLNSRYFFYGVGVIILLLITLIASWASLKSKKSSLRHRFKMAKEAGFNKEFELGSKPEDDSKHIEGQELLAGWKEAISSSSEASKFIKPGTLSEYRLLETSKFWAVKVTGDKETETYSTRKTEVAGWVWEVNENPEPELPTDYIDQTQDFAISKRQFTCPTCEGKGDLHCTTCDGKLEITCPDCSGDGSTACPSCNGAREFTCKSCGGRGSSSCSVCGGSGVVGAGTGRTTWTTTIDNKGTHSTDHTYNSTGSTCYQCHGNGRSSCLGCGGSGYTTCEKCKGAGKFDCARCSTKGIITCPDCKGTGRVKCHRCTGLTYLYDVDYKTWTYKHHSLKQVNKDIRCEIAEKDYDDGALAALQIDGFDEGIPDNLDDAEGATSMLEWARTQYSNWNVNGDRTLFERFSARLMPVTGIKVQAPAENRKAEAKEFWLWSVGGRSGSRLYAHETPDDFNTSFPGHKWIGRAIMLMELALFVTLVLMAFDISVLPL